MTAVLVTAEVSDNALAVISPAWASIFFRSAAVGIKMLGGILIAGTKCRWKLYVELLMRSCF